MRDVAELGQITGPAISHRISRHVASRDRHCSNDRYISICRDQREAALANGNWGTYRPRKIEKKGLIEHGEWSIKLYSIVQAGTVFDASDMHRGLTLACAELPKPARDSLRLGVAFAVFHQANAGRYIVLCHWDNVNELPTIVLVRSPHELEWRRAQSRESFCVWDLQVMYAERQIYIDTMLTGARSVEQYLTRFADTL